MKILYVTTIGGTMNFFCLFVKKLIDEGHVVDIATNENASKVPEYYRELGCSIYQIDTSRSPLSKGNLKAIRQLKTLVAKEKYDIVHCHTPVAAMCTRLACRKLRENGTKVFYTAHGFHFYKGAPMKNWLLYYPVEKFCSRFTDVLITINKEDYALAQKKLKVRSVRYVPGVGIDLTKFGSAQVDKSAKRRELGVPEGATLLLSVGELNKNKNHETVIQAIADLDVYYAIAGKGDLHDDLQLMIDNLGLTSRVKLLGYREDVAELYKVADVYVLPSFREGLNVSIMEAMASGLPIACSNIRGNVDLVDKNGGVLFAPGDIIDCKAAICKILSSEMQLMGYYNSKKISEFSVESINDQLFEIINETISRGE